MPVVRLAGTAVTAELGVEEGGVVGRVDLSHGEAKPYGFVGQSAGGGAVQQVGRAAQFPGPGNEVAATRKSSWGGVSELPGAR